MISLSAAPVVVDLIVYCICVASLQKGPHVAKIKKCDFC